VVGDGTLNVVQRARSERFAAEIRSGRPLREALAEGTPGVHNDAVVDAALRMLAIEGSIDMKRLAAEADMSRASLYRYYSDRSELMAEIAGVGFAEMVARLDGVESRCERIRVVGEYMLAEPATTIAMMEMAVTASTEALDAVSELLVGNDTHSPWFIGLASICATPRMSDTDVARVRRHIAELAALIDD
jgi:AcrR family transcriptional regulator